MECTPLWGFAFAGADTVIRYWGMPEYAPSLGPFEACKKAARDTPAALPVKKDFV
jgi:hypothetical protein